MKVINIHERELDADHEQVGALIDSLASEDDRLWPTHSWPRMRFDRPLGIGAKGGHGPIGYDVEEYQPGQSIRFRFTHPKGFHGFHRFEVVKSQRPPVILRHTIDMSLHGVSCFSWALIIRPLHDALLEDALATAQASLGIMPRMKAWSPWVKVVRWIMSGGKAQSRIMPGTVHGAGG